MDMTVSFDNFCMVIDNFQTKQECDNMINIFETWDKLNLTWDRKYQESNAHKISDTHVYSQDLWAPKTEDAKQSVNLLDIGLLSEFNEKFWREAYPFYTNKYSIIKDYPKHQNRVIKIQKTEVGGQGYHIWHSEDSSWKNRGRFLTWLLYLNDVEEGGETELIYLSKRVQARTGRLLLFPAGFTHTHRGNPPLNTTKYIATGWVELGE